MEESILNDHCLLKQVGIYVEKRKWNPQVSEKGIKRHSKIKSTRPMAY